MPQFRDPNEKRDFMLNTPIPRLVPKMALPSIAGMLVTSAYNLADTLFVSQLGTDATGAVGVNGSIDLIIMMAGSLLAVGAASLTSRLLGAKQDERAREVLSTCFFLALALGTLVLILGFTYQNKILLLLGANEEILPYSEQYCRYILLAAPFMATSFVLNQCLRAEGSAVFSMIGMVAGAVLNVGLDLLFIIVFLWGVAGAAAATVSAQLISTVGCFVYAFTKYPKIRPHAVDWKIDGRDVLLHMEQGIPLGLQFSVLAVGIIVMQSVVVKFDLLGGVMVSNAAQNGFGAANKLHNLLMTPLSGLGSAMTSFTAQNMGADRADRIKKGTLQALVMMVIIAGISVAAGLLLSINGTYLRIFLSADKITEETVIFGNHFLYIDLSLYVFLGFIFVMRNCVQGIGRPQFILGAGAAELVARVAICLFLPAAFAGGEVSAAAPLSAYHALCFADPAAWIAADLVLSVPFLRNIMEMDYAYFYRTRR